MASAGGPANILANANNVQITGGALTIVQGDVHNHPEGHGKSEIEAAIWKALRAVPNFRKIYQDMLGKATKGTGMWLFKNGKFRVWLEANGDIKIFWGSGMPGAGKTVLASLVIQHLETLRRASPSEICVCYFYFRYSDSSGLTVRGVLETLFKQTLERHPDAFGLVEQEYKQHLQEGTQPSETQLLGFLHKLADTMAVTFYVLDALDEAPPALQAAIVRTLSSLNVKLFITSRPLETVQDAFPQRHPFCIRADEGDIELHVTKGISNSPVLLNLVKQEGLGLRADILAKVKEKSDGMFLHAAFQMDALCSCVNLRQVKRVLAEFPSQIEGAYVQTWNRILDEDEENVSLVKMVFIWVLTATRSMTLKELERVVAICPETFKFGLGSHVCGDYQRITTGITNIPYLEMN